MASDRASFRRRIGVLQVSEVIEGHIKQQWREWHFPSQGMIYRSSYSLSGFKFGIFGNLPPGNGAGAASAERPDTVIDYPGKAVAISAKIQRETSKPQSNEKNRRTFP